MENAAFLFICACIGFTIVSPGKTENERRNETGDSNSSGHGLLHNGSPTIELLPLRFSFVTTRGGGVGYADLSIPALRLAVEHINANSSVLPNFRLEYYLNEPFQV